MDRTPQSSQPSTSSKITQANASSPSASVSPARRSIEVVPHSVGRQNRKSILPARKLATGVGPKQNLPQDRALSMLKYVATIEVDIQEQENVLSGQTFCTHYADVSSEGRQTDQHQYQVLEAQLNKAALGGQSYEDLYNNLFESLLEKKAEKLFNSNRRKLSGTFAAKNKDEIKNLIRSPEKITKQNAKKEAQNVLNDIKAQVLEDKDLQDLRVQLENIGPLNFQFKPFNQLEDLAESLRDRYPNHRESIVVDSKQGVIKDTKSGLYCRVLQDATDGAGESSELVMTFGYTGISDDVSKKQQQANVANVVGMKPFLFDQGAFLANELVHKQNRNVVIVGKSQGGAVAQYAALTAYRKPVGNFTSDNLGTVKQCVTLDPLPLSRSALRSVSRDNKHAAEHFITNNIMMGDWVADGKIAATSHDLYGERLMFNVPTPNESANQRHGNDVHHFIEYCLTPPDEQS